MKVLNMLYFSNVNIGVLWTFQNARIAHTHNILTICAKIVKLGYPKMFICAMTDIHTLCVHYTYVTANLNWGYSKYAKVACLHYFSTIELQTPHAMLTLEWVSRRVDSSVRRLNTFATRVILLWRVMFNDFLNLQKNLIYHIKKTKSVLMSCMN